MSFSPRNRAQLRQDFLDALTTRWAAIGREIDTRAGGFWYRVADGLGLVQERLEAWLAYLHDQILPLKAATAYLDRHGEVEALPREPATAAVLLVRVTGTATATVTPGSAVLQGTNGFKYSSISTSFALNGSGYLDVQFRCQTVGTVGNLADGATLTWYSGPPTNANPTAVVQSTVTEAQDIETDASYAARVIERRQERPAGGNRADWKDWVGMVTGVSGAWVYPLLHPSLGADTLGAVTVVAVGPAQGNSVTNTRVLSGGLLTILQGFLAGSNDKDGVTIDGDELPAATVDPADYSVETIAVASQDVAMQVTNAAAYAVPWTGTMTVDASSTTTSLVVTGDQTAKNGKQALVFVGTGVVRGGYVLLTLGTGSFGAGKTTWTIPAQGAAPAGTVYPAPPNWTAIRDTAFAYFDGLGPGDTSPPSRWPTQEQNGRSVLYRSALAARIISDVTGVLSCVVSTPGSDVTPAAKTVVTLGQLAVTVS